MLLNKYDPLTVAQRTVRLDG